MANKLYSVRINKTGKYVKYCDDCWYEVIGEEVRLFIKERAEEIVKQMRRHYVYDVTISNGTESTRYDLQSGFTRKQQKTAAEKKKSSASMSKLKEMMEIFKNK